MSYRQLTPEEEKYEENVWAAWEAFLLQMQDASEFVNTQTPLMTQLLEDTYQVLSSVFKGLFYGEWIYFQGRQLWQNYSISFLKQGLL